MLTVPELSVLIELSWYVVGLCHHSMAHPEFVEGINCLKIWRVAADILISCHGQVRRGVLSAWGMGEGLTIPQYKNLNML